MQIKVNDNEFQLFVGEKRILEHSKERPMIYVGVGQEDVDMYRGNFKITDYVTERFPLKLTDVIQTADTVRLCFESYIIAKIKCDENLCTIDFEQKDDRINRFWFRVAADKEEKCYGCGEQCLTLICVEEIFLSGHLNQVSDVIRQLTLHGVRM